LWIDGQSRRAPATAFLFFSNQHTPKGFPGIFNNFQQKIVEARAELFFPRPLKLRVNC
jgi:hypothetical protein